MKILLTNDDGIFSKGIYSIYLELKKKFSVFVVAPDSERSSIGHAITLSHPIHVSKIERKNKFFGYGISGTPADCVKLGIAKLLKSKPDLVISGINLGTNDGCSVFYSGTVAAAREAALMGIPSIALSLNTFTDPDYTYAAKFGAQLAEKILKNKLPYKTFLNVNIPNLKQNKVKGVKLTKQCLVPIHGVFLKRKNPSLKDYYWMSGRGPRPKKDLNIDTYALNQNFITITPLQCDLTDYACLDEVMNWSFL